MSIAIILAGVLFTIYVLWGYFLAVMCIKRARDARTLTRLQVAFCWTIAGPGYLLDALVNIFILSFILLEVPHELLVTTRLTRHKNSTGWRKTVADWFCGVLLDDFDPTGCHCD